jgi:uncharacterized protein (TIGR01777 family)
LLQQREELSQSSGLKRPLRIVIPGGSGQIGRILARHFHAQGHAVTVLARHPAVVPWRTVLWDAQEPGGWAHELDGADLVINLAGRSVNCRYNPANRREIKESRVRTTRLLGEAIAHMSNPPVLWMNASTATIYRHALDRAMDEQTGELGGAEPGAPSTWNFSIDVARSWEQAFFESHCPGTRKVALRSAMVMSPDRGGVLDVLLRLVRYGLGGAAGSGRQYVSWIHDADFLSAIDFLIAHPELDGVVNISSPGPLPNREFMRVLRQARGAPIGLPATAWMLEIGAAFLRTETELILKSRRVVPSRLLEAGFIFRFPEWREAAPDLLTRWRDTPRRIASGQ